jgi:ABC-2 type transport system permease protein
VPTVPDLEPDSTWKGSRRRLRAMVRKEFLQIRRDPSSVGIAFVMPMVLLLLFGYGVSLNAEHVPLAVVVEQPGVNAQRFVDGLQNSRYFEPHLMVDLTSAEEALTQRRVEGIIWLRSNFEQAIERVDDASIEIILNGINANQTRIVEGYLEGVWQSWIEQTALSAGQSVQMPVQIDARVWFNPSLNSRLFLVPGLIAVIMTLTGALLTALVIAREWERGTMESLMTTPITMGEILLGKLFPYFVIGMGGMGLSVLLAISVFGVPLIGSVFTLLLGSTLFMTTALAMGLFISSVARSQFVAGMAAIVSTFLPAFILSGFIFDISSMPWVVQMITFIVPARYFVAILQTVFLAGDIWPVILPNAAALVLMSTVLFSLVVRRSHKRLD